MAARLRDLLAQRLEHENPAPERAWVLAEAAYARAGDDAERGFATFHALLAQEPELEREFAAVLRQNWLATALVEDALTAGWTYDAATDSWRPPSDGGQEG